MISRQRLIFSFIFLLLASLLLAGCVRPVPEPEGTPVPAEPDTSDPDVGGGTVLDPTEPPATVAPTAAADSGEMTATGYPEATTVPPEEDNPTAEATETPTSDASDDSAPAPTPTPTETTAADAQPADETAVTEAATDTDCPQTHVVQPGENLFRIGLQYGQSWVTLAQANGLSNPNAITAGQTLQIPCEDTPPVAPSPTPDIVTYYTVQPGDNLFRIGLKFGISWVEIAEANGVVNPNQIYVGQVLKIPTSVPGPRPEFTHVVKQGETIYSISVQYGVPTAVIAEANNLDAPYVIYAGQTLIIPGNG